MRRFINRALSKKDKLNPDHILELFHSAAGELERIETVLDSLSEGITVLDARHRLVLANKYARRLLPPGISENSREIFWKQLRDIKVAAFLEKTILSGDRAEGWEFDDELNGRERRFSLSVMPLIIDMKVSGSLILVKDITEKRVREAHVRRMENLASLTTVAAGVAHEIKNPLGSLSIHVQLIQKILAQMANVSDAKNAEKNDTLNHHLSVVNEEIDRLNKIVVDFLFAVRPLSLDLRCGDINTLVKELADFVSHELEAAGIKNKIDLAENLPLVFFDEPVMKQALLNLIKNAIHAMPCGGKLSVRTSFEENSIHVTVADTGVGITEEALPKIFEPYYTTRDMGVGLGLTLVLKIVREHQCEIIVKSKPGKGSTFTILLPVPQTEKRLIGAPE